MRRISGKQVKHVKRIAQTEKTIADKLPCLVERMLELAEGVTVQEENKKGELNTYRKPPDRQAAEYLIDLIMKGAEKRASSDSMPVAVKIIEVTKMIG